MSTSKTAIILIDPYNDFLHPSGKAHAPLAASLASVNAVPNILALLAWARRSDTRIPVFYALHHQTQTHATDYAGWMYPTASNLKIKEGKIFEKGSWGAQFYEGTEPSWENGDVVATEHWNSSGFANTDLDFQLRKHGVEKVIMAGMIANTCLESSARYAMELGYHVTIVKDATAAWSDELYQAATLVYPRIVHDVKTVAEIIA